MNDTRVTQILEALNSLDISVDTEQQFYVAGGTGASTFALTVQDDPNIHPYLPVSLPFEFKSISDKLGDATHYLKLFGILTVVPDGSTLELKDGSSGPSKTRFRSTTNSLVKYYPGYLRFISDLTCIASGGGTCEAYAYYGWEAL